MSITTALLSVEALLTAAVPEDPQVKVVEIQLPLGLSSGSGIYG